MKGQTTTDPETQRLREATQKALSAATVESASVRTDDPRVPGALAELAIAGEYVPLAVYRALLDHDCAIRSTAPGRRDGEEMLVVTLVAV